jgi:hypothetical protein
VSKKEEKSLFDEIWETVKLEKTLEQESVKAEIAEEPHIEPDAKAPAVEEPIVEEPIIEEPIVEEPVAEEPTEEPVAEEPTQNKSDEHTEKKKSVQFLIIYTTVFLLVVSALIGGSYMITSRIHKEMAEKGELINDKSSTLKNVKDKLSQTQTEKEEALESNKDLTASLKDADTLIGGAGDMVEHNEYLSAAMSAYIGGERDLAKTIFQTIDRDKLSPTNQGYYDVLKKKLN